MTSRAYTTKEMRDRVLAHVRHISHYWATLPEKTDRERCDGVAFSILCMIDGVTHLPAMTLTMEPHPDDKELQISDGENWIESGMAINDDVYLHDLLYVKQEPGGTGEGVKS